MEEGALSTTIDEKKAAFTLAASSYFSLLSSIDVNLRRQIWALEEAGIISGDSTSKDGTQNKDTTATDGIPLGNLDVGWLNSRNDKVSKELEAEQWARARELIEGLEQNRARATKEGTVDAMET